MKKYAAESGFDFPYLYDGETQPWPHAPTAASPRRTSSSSMRTRKLRYKGRFDDSRYSQEDSTVKSPDARNAVKALLAGQPVPVEITKPHGCSTKWSEKKAGLVAMESGQAPGRMEPIDAAGVAALRAKAAEQSRLFNVWATWCAPCVAEFPELVATSRKFDMRDFEFISISMDEPKHVAKAKAFLEKQGAGLSKRKRTP